MTDKSVVDRCHGILWDIMLPAHVDWIKTILVEADARNGITVQENVGTPILGDLTENPQIDCECVYFN